MLAGLPGCYAPPRGNIWLAWYEDGVANSSACTFTPGK
jgi:hypothetical protein